MGHVQVPWKGRVENDKFWWIKAREEDVGSASLE